MAMLKVEHDPVWNQLGGRVLIPVHDELIAEVPIENWKEGGERLSKMMCEAANFLPFSIKCDVETTIHWYGLSYPCPYAKPDNLKNNSEDEVKWVQYYLFECGYYLPILKGPNGEKPEGDEAHGVNGVVTEDYKEFIQDYMTRYGISSDEMFIWHIEKNVVSGIIPDIKDYKPVVDSGVV